MNNRKKNKRTEKQETKNRINSRSSLPNSHSDNHCDSDNDWLNEVLEGRKRKNKKKGSKSIPKKKRRAPSIFIEEAGDDDNPRGDSDDASDNPDYEDDSRYYQRVYPGERVQPLGSKIEDKKVYFQCQDNETESANGHLAYGEWYPLLLDPMVKKYVQHHYFKDAQLLLPLEPPVEVLQTYGQSIGKDYPSDAFTTFYESECTRYSNELEEAMTRKRFEFLSHSQDSSYSESQLPLGDSPTISTICTWENVLEESILEEGGDVLSVQVVEALCKCKPLILGDYYADGDFHRFIAYVMNYYIEQARPHSTSTADETGSDTTEMSAEEAVFSDTGESVGNEYSYGALTWDSIAKTCYDVIKAKPFADDSANETTSTRNIRYIRESLETHPVIAKLVDGYFYFASSAFDPSEWHDDDDDDYLKKIKDALKGLYGGLISHPGSYHK
jgi:hypothetical protein